MKKIAILGSGFFGVGAALILGKKFKVDLYDRHKVIMGGASSSNQLRYHLGYHYPRSTKTLNEVQKSNKDFLDFYGNNIFGNTKNYYGVAQRLKTSYKNYIKFLEKNHLPFKKIDLDELKNVRVQFHLLKNINIFKIKKIIVKKIAKNKTLILN